MPYDPTLYQGSAPFYVRGRPPYSSGLVETLVTELGLDGSGRLLDVGCGPGILALTLAGRFDTVIGLDPDSGMLAEAARRAAEHGTRNVRWVQAVAEDIAALDLGRLRLVTFGQSFHWTDRDRVAEMVYDRLAPGGALALIEHVHAGRPEPRGPGYPPIPHAAIRVLIERYLGPRRRAGQGFAPLSTVSHAEVLARRRFGAPLRLFCAGRDDLVQDADAVVANYFSTSFAAPHLFGAERASYEAELRALLAAHSPSGLFWDWPGDTQILLARRPE